MVYKFHRNCFTNTAFDFDAQKLSHIPSLLLWHAVKNLINVKLLCYKINRECNSLGLVSPCGFYQFAVERGIKTK